MVPPFKFISRRSTPEVVLSRKIFFQNSARKMAKRIIVYIVKYLYWSSVIRGIGRGFEGI